MNRPHFADAVEATTGLKWETIVGPSRHYEVANVRHLVAYGARLAGWGCHRTTKLIGRRDHTTSIHAAKVASAFCQRDPRAKLFALAVRHALLADSTDHEGFDFAGVPFVEPAVSRWTINDFEASREETRARAELEASKLDARLVRRIREDAALGLSPETCLRHWPYGQRPSLDDVRLIMEAA